MDIKTIALVTHERRWLQRTVQACHVGAVVLALCSAVTPLRVMAGVGDLDPQFGTEGHTLIAGNAGPNVLELPDGRILIIGKSTRNDSSEHNLSRQVAINRFLPSGAPDTTFGIDGRAIIVLPGDVHLVSAAARQPDGKVVIAVTYWMEGQGGRVVVARIDAEGALDASFGTDGLAAPNQGGTEPFYSSVVLLANGDILATISDWTSDRIDRFATDGRPLGSVYPPIVPWGLAAQSDGRLIVFGWDRDLRQDGVRRVDLNGNVDPTFGKDGFAAVDAGYTSNMSIEPHTDRIVLCGPGIVRLTPDGQLDNTYGVQGTGYVAPGSDSVPMFDYCNRLSAMWDGSLVFIGIARGQAADGYDRAFLSGLASDGTADLRFGSGTGATEINIGAIRGSTSGWFDASSEFVKTRDGDALLTWWTDAGLQLARIDLNAGSGEDTLPPNPSPSPSPSPSPPASPPASAGNSGGNAGGGGALTWLDFALVALGAGLASRYRRNLCS